MIEGKKSFRSVLTTWLEFIARDIRIFSDKIARDPARLARGVVDRETPIK